MCSRHDNQTTDLAAQLPNIRLRQQHQHKCSEKQISIFLHPPQKSDRRDTFFLEGGVLVNYIYCEGNSPKFPGGTQILSLLPPHHLSPLISGYLSHGRGCDTCIAEHGQQPQRPLSGCGWKIKRGRKWGRRGGEGGETAGRESITLHAAVQIKALMDPRYTLPGEAVSTSESIVEQHLVSKSRTHFTPCHTLWSTHTAADVHKQTNKKKPRRTARLGNFSRSDEVAYCGDPKG